MLGGLQGGVGSSMAASRFIMDGPRGPGPGPDPRFLSLNQLAGMSAPPLPLEPRDAAGQRRGIFYPGAGRGYNRYGGGWG